MIELKVHPSYYPNLEHYNRHDDWVTSDPQSLFSYIHRTRLEIADKKTGEEYYQERLKNLDTENDIGAICDIHFSALVKEQPVFKEMDSDLAQDLLNNASGDGTSLWQISREVIRALGKYGCSVSETFKTADVATTAQEAEAIGERAYIRTYKPQHLVNWERFEEESGKVGQLKEVLLVNRILKEGDKEFQLFKRYWFDEESSNYKCALYKALEDGAFHKLLASKESIQAELYTDEKIGGIEEIPVVIIGDPVNGVKQTPIYREVYQSEVLLNKQSIYDQACRYGSSPRHVITGEDVKVGDAIALSNTHIGAVEGSGIDIKSFETADPIGQWRDIIRLRTAIRRSGLFQANQHMAPDSKEAVSVESKRLDDETRKDYYNQVIDTLENALEDMLHLSTLFDGPNNIPEDAKAIFKRDFDMETQEEKLAREEVVYKYSLNMGDAGHKLRQHLVVNKVQRMRFEEVEEMSEEDIQKELIEAVMSEVRNEGVSPTLRRIQERRASLTAVADNA